MSKKLLVNIRNRGINQSPYRPYAASPRLDMNQGLDTDHFARSSLRVWTNPYFVQVSRYAAVAI